MSYMVAILFSVVISLGGGAADMPDAHICYQSDDSSYTLAWSHDLFVAYQVYAGCYDESLLVNE